ncbi:MAG TPA: DUF378 domain-containing protein [Steroidobacteraceae bacterium]|nr:DUF378 domain-containing protein [Steroidobacteraceae bacterium]
MRGSYWIALVLLVIGGLNWLLVGAFDFDLVAAIFGDMSPAARVVYVLVGLAAIWTLISSARMRRTGGYGDGETRLASR